MERNAKEVETVSSIEENKALVTRLSEEIWNQGNVELSYELFPENYVAHQPAFGDPEPHGPQDVVDFVRLFRAGFPDIHIEILDIFGAGDQVAWRLSWSGTHTGDYLGMPPTGRKIDVAVIGVNRIVDGKIVEAWGVVDHLVEIVIVWCMECLFG
jgi:predicted SnoaL-like aldol condensation-catalyzing enzyme